MSLGMFIFANLLYHIVGDYDGSIWSLGFSIWMMVVNIWISQK